MLGRVVLAEGPAAFVRDAALASETWPSLVPFAAAIEGLGRLFATKEEAAVAAPGRVVAADRLGRGAAGLGVGCKVDLLLVLAGMTPRAGAAFIGPAAAVRGAILVGDCHHRQPKYAQMTRGPTQTLMPLSARALGVGLAALMLCLLPAVGSAPGGRLNPLPITLLGLDFAAPVAEGAVSLPLAGGFAFAALGVGFSSVLAIPGALTNMPCPGSHWKYRCPCTVPSFLPVASSRTTPIQSPGAKLV